MAIDVLSSSFSAGVARSNLTRASSRATASIAKLSSGNRITNASDDVSGMAVGTGLRSKVKTLQAGLQNTLQSSSMLQVADGALAEISDILQRQKQLAVMTGSGAMTDQEREFFNIEFQNLKDEIERLTTSTNFNGVSLLNGSPIETNDDTTIANSTFFYDLGTQAVANGVGAGRMLIVDATGNPLPPLENIIQNTQVYGGIDDIEVANTAYGVAADIAVTINGVEFTGKITHNGTSALVQSGEDYLLVGTAPFNLTDPVTAEVSLLQMKDDLKDVVVSRNRQFTNVNFEGTLLDGANTRVWMTSTHSDDFVTVENFRFVSGVPQYAGSLVQVDVDGITRTARVPDTLNNAVSLSFFAPGSAVDQLRIQIGQLDDPINGGGSDNVRMDENVRREFLDALNTAFGRAGKGLSLGMDSSKDCDIILDIPPVTTAFLYQGASMSVETLVEANATSIQLNKALDYVTSVRADVGAQQSRLNFASSNMTVALQNQDAARGVYQDTDVARESTRYATSQTQMQAAISVLAQVNAAQGNMLELLR